MKHGVLKGALLYLAMLVLAFLDFAFSPPAWERASGAAFLSLLALLPAFLVSGAASGWLGRVRLRLVRYPLIGAAYGGPVGAFLRAAMPLTAPSYSAEGPYRLTMTESALYGALLCFVGGVLLALLAAFRAWRSQGES